MEFVLLILALGGLLTYSAAMHGTLLVLHSLLAVWYAWKLKATQPLTAIVLLGYAPMYFINPFAILAGWIDLDSTEEALYLSNVLMMVGLDLFIVGAYRLRWTKKDLCNVQPVEIAEGRVDIVIVIALGIYLIASCVQILGVGSLDASRGAFDMQKTDIAIGGEHSIFFLIARYASFSLPFAGFLIALKRPAKQAMFLIPLAALLVLHFLLFRVRQAPVAVAQGYLLGALSSYLFVTLKGRPLLGHIPSYVRMTALVMIPALAVMAVSIRWVRAMYATGQYDFSSESAEKIAEKTFAAGDFAVAYMCRMAVQKFPSEHEYLNGLSVYRLFLTPIPRFIWPDKPETSQRIFAGVLDPRLRAKGVTIPAGLVGDLHINFGPWGVLGMIVLGFFFAQERYTSLASLMVLASSGAWIFHFTRGSQTGPIVVLGVTWLVSRLFQYMLAPQPVAVSQTQWPMMMAWRPALAMPTVARKLKPRGG
ncbi:MAG: hypothetical protein SGJ19_15990 [Planctomycetia bacterium]|nr:hypothetical protein [Planctomycetia bacterium]